MDEPFDGFELMIVWYTFDVRITKANVPNQCSWLNGSLSLSKDEAGRKLEINNFRYILVEGPAVKKQSTSGPSSASTSNNGSSNNKDAVPPARKMDEYKECLRDFYFNMLMKMGKLVYCQASMTT